MCLDAAAADAALTGRLFPGAIVNLLVDLVHRSGAAPTLQFPMLVALGAVLALPGLAFDAQQCTQGLFRATDALLIAEAEIRRKSSQSDFVLWSTVLHAMIDVCVALVEKLDLCLNDLPECIGGVCCMFGLIAFACGRRKTPPEFSEMPPVDYVQSTIELHRRVTCAFDQELVHAINRAEAKNGGSQVSALSRAERADLKLIADAPDDFIESRIHLLQDLSEYVEILLSCCHRTLALVSLY